MLCLELLDTELAYKLLSQVPLFHPNYNHAMFECGNIDYCGHKKKSQALSYFSKIKTTNTYHSPVLIAACNKKDDSSSITDIYTMQSIRTKNNFCVSGLFFTKNTKIAHQLFGCTKDKKISLAQVEEAWQEYKKIERGEFLRKETSTEIHAVYSKAKNPIYNDIGRYRVLREYVLNKDNQHTEFYKLLNNKFGKDFFLADDCVKSITPIVENKIA